MTTDEPNTGKPIKDANDLLQAWAREGVTAEEQGRRVREILNRARTMAEAAAGWAGQQTGPERDRAMKIAFRIIGGMDAQEQSLYRQRLARLLDMGVREYNDNVKAAKKGGGDDDRPDLVETLGGYIDGWLIEFVYDPEADKGRLAFRDPDRRIGTADHIDINGRRYVPKEVNSFMREETVQFASDVGAKKSTRELVAVVEAFINEHYLLETKYLGRIIAYYVLMTWIYDAFNALPYLRAVGEAGAGKSELMRRVGALCYRLLSSSGASSASSFFRATEMYRGTVFIDEADLHDGGDMSNEIVKFLNLGAMKGNSIWRTVEVMTENGKSFDTEGYQTYCPKLIAMRKDFRDDAVASRSITIKVQPREPAELRARGISLTTGREFRTRARAIRNLLLRWRLEQWETEIPVDDDLMDIEVSSRLNQVTMPLKAIARGDTDLMVEIERFLRIFNQEMVLNRSMTIAARIVEALWRIHGNAGMREKYVINGQDGYELMMIGDVRKVANDIIDEMNAMPGDDDDDDDGKMRKRKKDELSAKGVGHIIRNELQLQVGQRRGNGFPVVWDQLKMEGLAKRYGVDITLGVYGGAANAAPPNDPQPRSNGAGHAEQRAMFDPNDED